jgi:hypothetical protein
MFFKIFTEPKKSSDALVFGGWISRTDNGILKA